MEKISVRKFANELIDSGTKTIDNFYRPTYPSFPNILKHETTEKNRTQYRRNVALAAYK